MDLFILCDGAFKLPDTETETEPDQITEPNGNLCWCLSVQYKNLQTILWNPFFIGLWEVFAIKLGPFVVADPC